MESQKRNIAQLERIGATMEQRWSLEGENRKKKSRDEEEGIKIVDGRLNFYFLLFILFYFIFLFFSIFRTTRIRVYQSCCHISHKLMA